MKKISWFWVSICSLLIMIVLISWQQFGKLTPAAEILTEKEAKELVQERYQGNVKNIKLSNQQFHIELEKQNQLYIIKLDAESGNVLSFTQSSSATPTPTPPLDNEYSNKDQPPTRLSDKEAIDIAQKQVQGELDEIWLETENDQTHYLVKIETNDDREAIVQIHAITGDVISVTWDDHDRENNGDSDDD
jgi:uncharacterized membrane protein YkoI